MTWWLFLILHIVICLGYYILLRMAGSKGAFPRLLIVLVMPLAGLLALFLSDLFTSLDRKPENELDLVTRKDMNFSFMKTNEFEKEIQLVPIEEALVLEDIPQKRRMMLDAIKRGAGMYTHRMRSALTDSDVETVHYAAVAMGEAQRQFEQDLQRMSVMIEDKQLEQMVWEEYARTLIRYINSGLIEKNTLRKYRFMYVNYMEKLVHNHQMEIPEDLCVQLVNMLTLLQQNVRAEECAHIYLQRYPSSEQAYITLLQMYYTLDLNEKFYQTLQQMESIRLELGHEARELLNFWIGGEFRSV